MGRKKRIVKIEKVATIKCPNCRKNSRIEIPEDRLVSSFECEKCKTKILTPPADCCIICAFSKKKCAQSLIMEAKMKGLEIKREEKAEVKENKPIFLIDEKILKNSEIKTSD